MKKHVYTRTGSVLALCLGLLLPSCDNGFEELNTNPDASSIIVPEYVFTKAQYDALNNSCYGTGVVATGGSIQHFATYKDVPGLGDKYYFQQGNYPYDFFLNAYPNAVNEIAEVIRAVSKDANNVNKLSAARIWRVYIMHRITDLYGDIPYDEAAKGYAEGNFTPKYTDQSAIYADMLKELAESASAFDAAKPTFGTADMLYGGNVDKWKKFAYSLMLRLGSRLTKVDAGMAETWVKKAIAGGVITEDADAALIKYSAAGQDIIKNPMSLAMRTNDYGVGNGDGNTEGGKLAKTLIDFLKTNKDPRLGVIAVVWNGATADTAAALQQGMPNGLLGKPANFKSYSEPNPNTILKLDAPILVLTNAETNLLLADAALRGWYSSSAASAYENGVRAAMKNWALYGSAGVISAEKINTYLANHPLQTASSIELQMEQIHTQIWASLFPDEQEVFANFRRTGYPKLTPVNIVGNLTNGTIPRRLLYPPAEESLNAANLQAAVSKQGANLLTTRIWWDK